MAQLEKDSSVAQIQLENPDSKSQNDSSSLRTKFKNVLLENIRSERTIRNMESEIEQLKSENTRLKNEKKPLYKTTHQVLEFTKQVNCYKTITLLLISSINMS